MNTAEFYDDHILLTIDLYILQAFYCSYFFLLFCFDPTFSSNPPTIPTFS